MQFIELHPNLQPSWRRDGQIDKYILLLYVREVTVNLLLKPTLSAICIWQVCDWIAGESVYWACPRLGIKGLRCSHSGAGGGGKVRRKAGAVVTSTQHTWWQWSKCGHDASRYNPYCPTYHLPHTYRQCSGFMTIDIVCFNQLSERVIRCVWTCSVESGWLLSGYSEYSKSAYSACLCHHQTSVSKGGVSHLYKSVFPYEQHHQTSQYNDLISP